MADRRFVLMGEKERNVYEAALNTLIESWDALDNGNGKNVQQTVENLFEQTANKILQVNWAKVNPELKCRLTSGLKNCLSSGKLLPDSSSLISALIELSTTNPWYNTDLNTILNDQIGDDGFVGSHNRYCESMNSEILWLQLQRLVKDGCEDLALKLCTCCLRYSSLKNEKRLHDMYYRLLFQLSLIDRLTNELLSSYTCEQGIEFVNRVLESSDNDALSFASCLIQIFLVRDLFSQNTYSYTKNLMEMWIDVQYKLNVATQLLWDQVMMLASIFTTSAHYYLIVDILSNKFGTKLLRMYVELYIKGLTVDLNFLENARMEQTKDISELEVHFANVLCNLAQILDDHSLLARECFLSAFSINPTKERLSLLKKFALAKEKKIEPCSGFCHCTVQGACRQSATLLQTQVDDVLQEGIKSQSSSTDVREDEITREVKMLLASVLDRISSSEEKPWNVSHYIFDEQSKDLPEEILEDLTIVLDEPRNKTLSWELNWSELQERCEIYLETKSAMRVMMAALAKTEDDDNQMCDDIEPKIVATTSTDTVKTDSSASPTSSLYDSQVLAANSENFENSVLHDSHGPAVSEANPMFYLDRPTKETSFLKEALTRTNLIKLVRVTDLKAKGEPVLLEELKKREFSKSQSLVSFKSVPYFNVVSTNSTKTNSTNAQAEIPGNSACTQIHSASQLSMGQTSRSTTILPSLIVKTQAAASIVQCDNSKSKTSLATKTSPQKNNAFIHLSPASAENLVSKIPIVAHTALMKAGLTLDQMNPKVVISHSEMADANKLLINSEKLLVSGGHGTVAVAIDNKDRTKSPNGINSEILKDEKSPKKQSKKGTKSKKDILSSSKAVGAAIQLPLMQPIMQLVAPMQLQTSVASTENKFNLMTLTQSTPKTVSTPVQIYTNPVIASSVVIPVSADQKSVTTQNVLTTVPSARLHVKFVDNNSVTFSKSPLAVARPTPSTGSYVLFNARCAVINPNASANAAMMTSTNSDKIRIVSQPSQIAPVVLQSSSQSGPEFIKPTNSSAAAATVDTGPTNPSQLTDAVGTDEPPSNPIEDTIPLAEALLNLCDEDEPGKSVSKSSSSTVDRVTEVPISDEAVPKVMDVFDSMKQQEPGPPNEDTKAPKNDEIVTLYSDSGTVASANFDSSYKWMVLGEKQAGQTSPGFATTKAPNNSQMVMLTQSDVVASSAMQNQMLGVVQHKPTQQLLTVNSVVIPAQVQTTTAAFGNVRKGKLFPSRKKAGPVWTSVRNQHGGMEYKIVKGLPDKGNQKKSSPKRSGKSTVRVPATTPASQSLPVTCVNTVMPIGNFNQVKKVDINSLNNVKAVQVIPNADCAQPTVSQSLPVTRKLNVSRIVTSTSDCNFVSNPYSVTTISNLKTFKVNKHDITKVPKPKVVPQTPEDEKIMQILSDYKEKAKAKSPIAVGSPEKVSSETKNETELIESMSEPQSVEQVQLLTEPLASDNSEPNEDLSDLSVLCNLTPPVNPQPFFSDVNITSLVSEPANEQKSSEQSGDGSSDQPTTAIESPKKQKSPKRKKSSEKKEKVKLQVKPQTESEKKSKKAPTIKATCPECGKDYSNGYNMKRHFNTVHHQKTNVKVSQRKSKKSTRTDPESPPVLNDDLADVDTTFINEVRVDDSLEKYISDENNCDFRSCMNDYQPSLSDIVNSDFERDFNLFSDPEMSESLANDNSNKAEIKSDFNTSYLDESVNNGFSICSNLQATNSPRTILERFSYIKKDSDEEDVSCQKTSPLIKNENEETDDNSRNKSGRMRARNSSHSSKRCGCCDSPSDGTKKVRLDSTTRALRQVRITKLRVMPLEGKQTKSVLRR